MDTMTMLAGFMGAFGLSSATGLNAYLPLLALGAMHQFHLVTLQTPYDQLGNPWVMAAIVVVGVVDFVGDKIPAVDHALHMVGLVVAPIAGAVVFGSQTGAITDVHPLVGLAAGCLISGGVQVARAGVRSLSSVTTAGAFNPFISLAEDAAALGLAILSILVPVVAFFLAIGVVAALLVAVRRWWRRRQLVRVPAV